MDWYVMRHPEIAMPGVVPDSALEDHRNRGWLRVSDPIVDRERVVLTDYADAPDLDAAPAAPEATDAKAPAKQTKEK